MIKPTVGRVMWYWPVLEVRGEQPLASLVAFVHDENLVNLAVFNSDGSSGGVKRVQIVQDGSPHRAGDGHYCEWMPFQVGQAKRHEAEKSA